MSATLLLLLVLPVQSIPQGQGVASGPVLSPQPPKTSDKNDGNPSTTDTSSTQVSKTTPQTQKVDLKETPHPASGNEQKNVNAGQGANAIVQVPANDVPNKPTDLTSSRAENPSEKPEPPSPYMSDWFHLARKGLPDIGATGLGLLRETFSPGETTDFNVREQATLALTAKFLEIEPKLVEKQYSMADIGTADGVMANFLKKEWKLSSVKGFDVATFEDNSHAVFSDTGKPKVDINLFDGKKIPLDDKSMDVVTFAFVLHHAAGNTASLVGEARRVAREYVIVLEDLADDDRFTARNYWHEPQGIFRTKQQWIDLFAKEGLVLAGEGSCKNDAVSKKMSSVYRENLQHFFIFKCV